jgi:hypothetical protein
VINPYVGYYASNRQALQATTTMQNLTAAQIRYDREVPEDLRTDAEIERDVCLRRRERRLAAVRAAKKARWAAMNQPKAEASIDGEHKTDRT